MTLNFGLGAIQGHWSGTIRKLGYGFLFHSNCRRIFGRFDKIHERDRQPAPHDSTGRSCA